MNSHYAPHIIFTLVFFAAFVPVLYYYQRKNPDPRFRPHFGEMSMVTLFVICLCGGLGYGIGSLINPENDGRAMNKKPNEGAGWSDNREEMADKERDRARRESNKSSGGGRRGGGDSDE